MEGTRRLRVLETKNARSVFTPSFPSFSPCLQSYNAIGWTIEDHADACGFKVCREFVGHGIGRTFHGPPDVRSVGVRAKKEESTSTCLPLPAQTHA